MEWKYAYCVQQRVVNLNHVLVVKAIISKVKLKPVNVDVLFVGNAFLDQELSNLRTLITRQLNHLPKSVIDKLAIACQLLLQHPQDPVAVKLLLESLHDGPRLSSIALLNSNVYVIVSVIPTLVREVSSLRIRLLEASLFSSSKGSKGCTMNT